ncbi:hypothetical protein Tco_1368240, partial [Tanacetum coccineum]
ALLVTHLSELNEDECFDPGGDEIEACLTSDSIHRELMVTISIRKETFFYSRSY